MKILTVASNERNSLQVTKLIGISKEKFIEKYAKKIEGRTGSPQGQNKDPNPSTTARHTADAPSNTMIAQDNSGVKGEDTIPQSAEPTAPLTQERQSENENYSAAEKYDIPEGSEIENNIVVDEYSRRLKGTNPRAYSNIIRMAKRLGMNVRFVKGLTDKNGKVLDGLITSKGIFINADAKNPSRFVATHEFSHRIRQAAPEVWAKYQEYVIAKLKRESFDGKRSKYEAQFEEKRKAYGKDKSVDYINEEIAADYIGDLFKNESELEAFIREDKSLALKVRDWWYNVLEKMGLLSEKKKAQQMWLRAYTAAAKEVAEGKVGAYSGEKYYINPTFNRAFDNWVGTLKRRNGVSLKVGVTSEALVSIGVKEQNIYWDTTKINDTLKEHPDIDIKMLKSIPNLIENPVLIMEEHNKKANKEHGNNRIFLLGELYNANGIPIIAFLELEPTNRDGIYLNEIKIVSTHSRVDETAPESFINTKNFVKKSRLLYVDPNKNRTNNWLARNRLQLPFLPTTYGPINKITYSNDFVNTNSMQNTAENAQEGKKSVAGTRLSELEEKYGTIKKGSEPRRDVSVPKRTQKDNKVRQFARTAAEATTLSEETSEGVLENVADGKLSYTPISDKSAMDYAYSTLDTMGFEWVEKKVNGAIANHSFNKNTVALAEVLLQSYDEMGQQEKAQQLIIDFAAETTRMGQCMQAISMLKKLDKNYEVSYIDKIVENLREEIIERNAKWYRWKKTDVNNIEVSEELKNELREAKTEAGREEIREKIFN